MPHAAQRSGAAALVLAENGMGKVIMAERGINAPPLLLRSLVLILASRRDEDVLSGLELPTFLRKHFNRSKWVLI